MHALPEHQGCLKEEILNRFNVLVQRCALVLGMDGKKTNGEKGGPIPVSGSSFLGVALPKDT